MSAAKESMRRKTAPSDGSLADQRRAGVCPRCMRKMVFCASAHAHSQRTRTSLPVAAPPSAQTDAHEKQRRALLADAYSRVSQDQGEEEEEEEEEIEDVMDDLDELARAMAQFKELTVQQQQLIERSLNF